MCVRACVCCAYWTNNTWQGAWKQHRKSSPHQQWRPRRAFWLWRANRGRTQATRGCRRPLLEWARLSHLHTKQSKPHSQNQITTRDEIQVTTTGTKGAQSQKQRSKATVIMGTTWKTHDAAKEPSHFSLKQRMTQCKRQHEEQTQQQLRSSAKSLNRHHQRTSTEQKNTIKRPSGQSKYIKNGQFRFFATTSNEMWQEKTGQYRLWKNDIEQDHVVAHRHMYSINDKGAGQQKMTNLPTINIPSNIRTQNIGTQNQVNRGKGNQNRHRWLQQATGGTAKMQREKGQHTIDYGSTLKNSRDKPGNNNELSGPNDKRKNISNNNYGARISISTNLATSRSPHNTTNRKKSHNTTQRANTATNIERTSNFDRMRHDEPLSLGQTALLLCSILRLVLW